ncbi:hypothetical protein AB0L54_35240 [Streptomyces sp. NPDC052196]|uniref:hypothetical protein n=1 Tax=Streptomyces sp. NPDC052196 TaxID=3156691 RepID=UPI00344932B9
MNSDDVTRHRRRAEGEAGVSEEWERGNRAAFGMAAWRRALMTCGALVVWHTGYDKHSTTRGGPRPGCADAPDTDSFARHWMPVTELLALAACRAAQAADVLVDDVELTALLGWVDGAYTDRIHEGDLDTRGAPAVRWTALVTEDRRLRARYVVVNNVLAHIDSERPLADTADGTPPPALLLGDRARAVRAAGIPDLGPEWAGDVTEARAQIDRLDLAVRGGLWVPEPAHRKFARLVHGTLVAEPDYPALPDAVAGPAWVQRLLRMPHIESTVITLTNAPGFEAFGPRATGGDPLGRAVGSLAHNAVHSLVATAADIERLWTARPAGQSIALWEREHLPMPLRTQLLEVERAIAKLTILLFEIGYSNAGR